ncbi:NAD(P)/FAD-dependent oxidoreductase [Planosporangium flavigriseum]|uniref:Ferredoxin--NADP reductase n=1 Tax=Planosporangium flavigriseum TaxID=373681 RepID=A0A8J3PJC3_9ACTN|nr:NAD(P)/FAD-dependent oxidoreductase [Planosporangium flavigriseum]NJC63455.1 NAD(P)/FAD-dependent oxidoreductase [Planosporangium flavigriseum]GIG72151.1 ferredoxin--NADP reductase [Planosporangium flavigriseum]
MREIDVAIVGAGPTGLFAAYYAGFRGLSVAVIDALPEPGGQVSAMYPEKVIYDVAGFPAVKGRELVANLVEQAAAFNPDYLLGARAEELTYVDGKPVLTLSTGEVLQCGAIIVTGGMGSFTARPLPAAAGFSGAGIVYFVPRLAELAGHDVVIVGGGDSAFDWALSLQPIANSITLVHRRDKFRAHPGTVARVQGLGIPLIVNAEVSKIRGNERVEGVDVTLRGGETRELCADTIVAALGFTADLGPLATWGFDLARRNILVNTTMATNLPRVYAAGDISEYPGKVRLIATGFGEAATAVNNAAVEINPGAHLFPGHSSENG